MFDQSVSPRFATYVHVYLTKIGVDPARVFDRAGIAFNKNKEYYRPLSVVEVANLFNVAAEEANDNCFGLRMGENFSYESAGLSILAMTSAPNLEKGLKQLVHYGRFIDNALDQRFTRTAESFTHSIRLTDSQELHLRHFHEYLVMLLNKMVRTTTRTESRPIAVSFAHSREATIHKYALFLGTDNILFDQRRNGLTYENDLLTVPFITANKLLHSLIINSLKTFIADETDNEFTDVVCREMMRLTSKEIPSIETVATNLSVSVRTLRRKLKSEGFTFQAVKQLALERRAKQLLHDTNLPLGEISYEVGYSEVSAFCRAFRRWTGYTPQEYRDCHVGEGQMNPGYQLLDTSPRH